MATERTLSIIKPDATRRNLTGKINAALEAAGLRIVAQKRIQLTKAQAEAFYAVHKERPFFGGLVAFMISGPVIVQVLEGDNAVARNRETMERWAMAMYICWLSCMCPSSRGSSPLHPRLPGPARQRGRRS